MWLIVLYVFSTAKDKLIGFINFICLLVFLLELFVCSVIVIVRILKLCML